MGTNKPWWCCLCSWDSVHIAWSYAVLVVLTCLPGLFIRCFEVAYNKRTEKIQNPTKWLFGYNVIGKCSWCSTHILFLEVGGWRADIFIFWRDEVGSDPFRKLGTFSFQCRVYVVFCSNHFLSYMSNKWKYIFLSPPPASPPPSTGRLTWNLLICTNLIIHNSAFYVIELFGFPLTVGFCYSYQNKRQANRVGELIL